MAVRMVVFQIIVLLGSMNSFVKAVGLVNAGTEPGFKLRGMNFFVQRFLKIEISILEVVNNALLALNFLIICIF